MKVLVLLSLLWSSSALAAGHALIVTNNRSLDLARPDLHYADDDGAKWAELFGDLVGGDVTLLTELDVATRALHPQLVDLAAPSRTNLDVAVRQLNARLDADHDGPRVVYLVFAGHGDVADGQGFIELADQRFTAADLEGLVAALPADHIHLVMDACNAWFMLHPRKPGARRFTREVHTEGLLERHPNVGALLSTSAEAVAWEWSEIQSGIFSHVVRSGLRGPADADRDGKVSYRELEAWLAIAHQAIANEAYRPRIFAHAPAGDDTFVALDGSFGRDVSLVLESSRRLTVRDALGERILDANLEAGAPLTLRLPKVALDIDELHAGTPRPTLTTLPLPIGASVIDAIATPRDTATRGEGELFDKLFSTPYGSESIERWAAAPPADDEAPYGVTAADAARLGYILETGARLEHNSRAFAGLITTTLGGVVTLSGIGLLADGGPDSDVAGWSVVGVGGLLIGAGLLTSVITGDLEDLALAYHDADFATEAARATTVARFEAKLAEQAQSYRRVRQVTGWGITAMGALTIGFSLLLAGDSHGLDLGEGMLLGSGIGFVSLGLWDVFSNRHPIEETWRLYNDIREIPWSPGGTAPVVRPVLAPIEGGALIGVDGSF